MVGVDADGYGHSLARTYTLTIHPLHKHTQLAARSTLAGSEMAPPKTRELTNHTSHSQLTLTLCGCPLVFAAQYGCSRPSYLPIFVLESEMGIQHSNIAKYDGRGHRPGAISRGE